MSTVALVPAYRRADRVGATVGGLLPLVDEVVVVDDGSADAGATADAARRAGATVVALAVNRGKGGALAAGIAATPQASTYLLVDADTADTAAATAPLLAAVEEGADLAIGVLPPAGGRGGFGAVRHLAGWGIRRACGFEAAAPLSGQRAVGASLLRSLELADRFGVEAAMTIDAVRVGARVVEVPVGMDHAHTGRGVAGFSHRAAQGWDLIRVLWPRLLAEPARHLVLAAAAVAVVALLAVGGAAAVPTGTPLGRARQVVMVAAPPTLRLDDLDDPGRPELAALAGRRGAVAATSVDVPGRTAWSSWATVGAGAEVRAGPPSRAPDPSQPFRVQDVEEGQGRLGDALRQAGRTTAFVGTEPTSPVRLAVADGAGRIGRAATAASLGVAGLVNRARADLASGADVVAVDATGLGPADLEILLAGLRSTDGRQLLLVVTPADPSGGSFGLRPLVASGPGAPAGRLVSPSTRRDGLVVLSDVGPTILGSLGLPPGDGMVGRPLRQLDGSPDVPGLVEADRLARQRDTVWDPALLAVVPLHFAIYAWGWRRHRRSGNPAGGGGGAGRRWAGSRRADAQVPSVGLATPRSLTTSEAGGSADDHGRSSRQADSLGDTEASGGGGGLEASPAGPAEGPRGEARPLVAGPGGGLEWSPAGSEDAPQGRKAPEGAAAGSTRGSEEEGRPRQVGLHGERDAGSSVDAAEVEALEVGASNGVLAGEGAGPWRGGAEQQRRNVEPQDQPRGGARSRQASGGATAPGRAGVGRRWRELEKPALLRLGLGLVAWPLATWITRALPGTASLGRWAGLLALALDVVVVVLALRVGRGRGLAPLAAVLGATVALVSLDLGVGAPLQLSSAFGGAAHSTGRFTGLGNAAFAVYAASALLAVACGRRRAPWMVALLVLVALVDALPSLGGDVGGALTLVPIFSLAVAALWGRLRWNTVLLAGAATALVLGVALAVDLSRPADARTHLARFVTGRGASSSIGGKIGQNLGTYAAIPALAAVVAITIGFAVLLWRRHFLRALPPGSPARIGVAAALAVALVGNLLNDSGPIVTLLAMSIISPSLVVRSVAIDDPSPRILSPRPGAPTLAASP